MRPFSGVLITASTPNGSSLQNASGDLVSVMQSVVRSADINERYPIKGTAFRWIASEETQDLLPKSFKDGMQLFIERMATSVDKKALRTWRPGRQKRNAPPNLGGLQKEVLRQLSVARDPIGLVELADKLRRLDEGVTDGAVYSALNRLRGRGLVQDLLDSELPRPLTPSTKVGRGRPRKLFQLTLNGRRAIEQGVSSASHFSTVNERIPYGKET